MDPIYSRVEPDGKKAQAFRQAPASRRDAVPRIGRATRFGCWETPCRYDAGVRSRGADAGLLGVSFWFFLSSCHVPRHLSLLAFVGGQCLAPLAASARRGALAALLPGYSKTFANQVIYRIIAARENAS